MVKEGRAERLRRAGITTVESLWKADLAKLAEHPAFQVDDGFLGQLPLLQGYAEAHAKGTAIVYAADPRLFAMEGPVVHMDLEFDGPASEIFLWGFLDHRSDRLWQWFDSTRDAQRDRLEEFRKWCKDERPTIVTWGGNSSDLVQLRRACERFRMKNDWIREVDWLDLQTDVVYTGNPETQRIYLPVKRFSSDTVAQYFGYDKPRLKIKDGYKALKLYQAYKRNGRDAIKRDLCEYNAEDIKHTKIILDGIRGLMKPLA